jgi:hypothetical protein
MSTAKSKRIVDQELLAITIDRLCYQLIENHNDFQNSVIIGLQPRGVFLSRRIYDRLKTIKPEVNLKHGELDISFFRDDFRRREMIVPSSTKMDFIVEGKKVILVDESKLKKIPAGNPKVVPTNTNVHPAGKPKVVLAGKPRVIVPGTDTFSLPKKVPAIDSPFVAGIPEVTLAKDPHINDNNPQSFSSFSKLQGLKHDVIRYMLQDKSGNLWFGTQGGGVSKYDGQSFTHFTEKEGLSNNLVSSILEDKNGNLWFGTQGGGVSKYDGQSFTHFTEK